MEVAGQSQATATGLLTVSNQLGAVGGASLGGVMLSLGSVPVVGLFCLATAATAAVVSAASCSILDAHGLSMMGLFSIMSLV